MMSTLYSDLLKMIEGLLLDVKERKPTYSSSSHIIKNPTIQYISLALGYHPQHFAKNTKKGIQYNEETIQKVKQQILQRKAEKEAVRNLRQYAF
jgi:hypothetical protein